MQVALHFHEDVFYEYFVPFRHPAAHFNIWGGFGLETFGGDFQTVKGYPENYVWTVVDGCEGSRQWITPGIHFVNRVCYLLTEKPHDWLLIEFFISNRPHSLTPLGLRRRMSTLSRLLQSKAARPS